MSEQRLAVVTGGARGIGRAIVMELLKQGKKVAALDLNADNLAELESVAKEAGFEVITKCCDITNTDQLTEMLEDLGENEGGVEILVNNAGITRDKLMMQMEELDFDLIMNVNLKSMFLSLFSVKEDTFKRCLKRSRILEAG